MFKVLLSADQRNASRKKITRAAEVRCQSRCSKGSGPPGHNENAESSAKNEQIGHPDENDKA